MCLGLSHLPKCPFQDHFLKKITLGQVLWTSCLWNATSFRCFRELGLISAAERVLWMECKSCFWEEQADFLRCAWVYTDNYWEESSRSLEESKCSYFIQLFLPGLVRPNRIKNWLGSCTFFVSWLFPESPCVPSGSFSHWLCMSHCTFLNHLLNSQSFIVSWMSINIGINSTSCANLSKRLFHYYIFPFL